MLFRSHDLFDEWMDNIECLDAFVTDKPIDMEINGEATYYMDEDLAVLMLREEGTCWETPAIVEATTELKNWAWEGACPPCGGLREEDQNRQVSHSCQEDQDR